MISLRPSILALLALSGTCLVAGATEPAVKEKPKDPQAAYEPRSEPGAGQKFLERFVGDWEVLKTFHPRSGDPVQASGECRQLMVHGGRFLQSDFVFHQGGKDSTGMGVIGFEADSGRFTSFWTDSRSTRMSVRQSEGPFNGKEIVLHSRSLNPDEKDARRSRTVTRLEDDGRKIVHRQYTAGADGTERLVMELVMTRKAGAPKSGN